MHIVAILPHDRKGPVYATVNTTAAADDLVMQGARASAAMVAIDLFLLDMGHAW